MTNSLAPARSGLPENRDESGSTTKSNPIPAFGGGALIGVLGELIGLGGAEFRLPLLIGPFRFKALEAVILNKAMSLVVVASALPFRAATVPFGAIASIGRSSSTCWPAVSWGLGSAPVGRHASVLAISTASWRCCSS